MEVAIAEVNLYFQFQLKHSGSVWWWRHELSNLIYLGFVSKIFEFSGEIHGKILGKIDLQMFAAETKWEKLWQHQLENFSQLFFESWKLSRVTPENIKLNNVESL